MGVSRVASRNNSVDVSMDLGTGAAAAATASGGMTAAGTDSAGLSSQRRESLLSVKEEGDEDTHDDTHDAHISPRSRTLSAPAAPATNAIPLPAGASFRRTSAEMQAQMLTEKGSFKFPSNFADAVESISSRMGPAVYSSKSRNIVIDQPVDKSLKILLVDDSLSILKMVGMLLRKHKHKVDEAENGALALDKLQASVGDPSKRYDVVVMDIQVRINAYLQTLVWLIELCIFNIRRVSRVYTHVDQSFAYSLSSSMHLTLLYALH